MLMNNIYIIKHGKINILKMFNAFFYIFLSILLMIGN